MAEVMGTEVPMKTREALRNVGGMWYFVRRTRKSFKKSNSNLEFKVRGKKLQDSFLEIKDKCILSNGSALQCMWRGDNEAWLKDGGDLMKRITVGIERFEVDSEGVGIWFHLSWLESDGAEASLVDPKFFQRELV